MSIIYSYPEQGALNANDMLIGTSAEKVGGKQKNITRNFSIQQIADFINRGAGFVDPIASDFQIPVFNQEGKKITGSIMSQNIYPNGSAITIAGSLTATGAISTVNNLTASGIVSLGSQNNLISLNSITKLGGPIKDAAGTIGNVNQILLSNGSGNVIWQNYEAGLTYEGTWDALNNTTNGLSNSPALVQGVGVSGHFYIVNVEGTTSLGPGLNDWHVGDWAVFLDEGGQPASWQKIDNTSTLVGSGTAGTFAKWTDATTLNDSIMSESGTVVSVDGDLKVKDTVEATTTNSNLKLKGNGTGGIEIMSADGTTDGKITLNCSQNSHGVTLQSPAHGSTVSYTLILPTSFGGAGDVLTSAGANPSQLVWTTPTTGTITNFTTVSTAIPGITTTVTNPTTTPGLTLSITGTPGAGLFLDGTGNWSSPGGGVTDITATAPLNADVSTGSVTLSMPAYATATGGYVPSGGASGQYLDGLSGNWTSLPVSGVTSVTSSNNDTLTVATTTTTPVITAVTAGGVGTGNNNLTTGDQVQTAIDSALAGAVTFKGTFNANTGSITGTSDFLYNPGINTNTIPIAIGDMYIVTVAGNFYGNTALNVGDEVIAIAAAAINQSSEADWNAVASGAGGAITGSGTTSYIPKFTGSTVVGDSSMFDDGTNIGINTISPVSALHVSTTVNEVLTLQSITSSQKIKFNDINNSTDDSDFGSVSGDLAMFTNSNGTPNTQSFTFNKDGKLGIGQFSTSPQANLDISDLLFNPSLRLYGANTGSELKIEVSNFFGNFNTTINSAQNDLIFQGNNSAIMSLGVSGQTSNLPIGSLRLNQYGQGNKTGTATYNLTVDGFGNVIEDPISGGASATITSNQTTTSNATTTVFLLGATPNGNSVNFVDVFIDGVYQETTTYSVSGASFDEITFNSPVPSGVTVETKTTADYNVGAAVNTVSLGQSNTTGDVDLRIVPLEVTSGQTIPGNANSLYIFTATGAQSIATVTLPGSPTLGDSIKISNLGGLANVLGANGNKIMGVAADLTINTPTAAFELIWSGSNNGWIIIGNV
jgi:hypothetical protein